MKFMFDFDGDGDIDAFDEEMTEYELQLMEDEMVLGGMGGGENQGAGQEKNRENHVALARQFLWEFFCYAK